MRGFPGFMNQRAASQGPGPMPASARTPMPGLPTAPTLKAPVAPAAPLANPPAVRQMTVATVTRNLQSVLGPAAQSPPSLPSAPASAFPGFVSRQFGQLKPYAPAASNEGHLKNLASMFAAEPQLGPDRRNLPRTAPPRPASLPVPVPRAEISLAQTLRAARLGKLARAKAERLKLQAESAQNQVRRVAAAPAKALPRLQSARAEGARPTSATLPPKPAVEAPRPKPPEKAAAQSTAPAPVRQPLMAPATAGAGSRPAIPVVRLEVPRPAPPLTAKPAAVSKPAVEPPIAAPKTVVPKTESPAIAPQPTLAGPTKPQGVADSKAMAVPPTVAKAALAVEGGGARAAAPVGEPLKDPLPRLAPLETGRLLPQVPRNEDKAMLGGQQRPETDSQRSGAEVKISGPQQRSDLADIKVSSGLNEVQRGLLPTQQHQGLEKELLPQVEQAGLGFSGQGGGGGGGGQQQGRRRRDDDEERGEEPEQDALEGGTGASGGVGASPRGRGDSLQEEWWHRKGGPCPTDLKLEMDWLSGPALAWSSELREAQHSLRGKEPAGAEPWSESPEGVRALTGRDQGKFSEEGPRRDPRQTPPKARQTELPEADQVELVDTSPDLSGLCVTCGTDLSPGASRCPLCLKAHALATLKILTADPHFIAYRVFLTVCRQPVESQAVFRLRDFALVPRGAFWVRPVSKTQVAV